MTTYFSDLAYARFRLYFSAPLKNYAPPAHITIIAWITSCWFYSGQEFPFYP